MPGSHPHVSILRQRAAGLRQLADSIEAAGVMRLTLDDPAPRVRLCVAMLERNQHQLHAAVEDLRDAAWSLQIQADELDHVRRVVAGGRR